MIIIEVSGGLGNQLQQYALYEKFKSLGKSVKLDLDWYGRADQENPEGCLVSKGTKRNVELDYFPNISYEVCTAKEKEQLLGKHGFLRKLGRKMGLVAQGRYREQQMYDQTLFSLDDRVLTGYWACEAYYADILPLLRERLQFPPSENPENARLKREMEGCNSVSIHLRRGDYLTAENQRMFGGICTDSYYEAAIQYLNKQVKNPHFFVFSDDPEYARKAGMGTVVHCNHGADSFYDIDLMSSCKHHICANSTFSFWGARLGSYTEGIKIRPLKQKNGVDWYQPERMKQLWKGWICLDEQGVWR